MELGLFTCGYQRYPLEQAFEDAGRFGYDYIELWGGYPHAYVEDLSLTGVREVERLVQKYHIPTRFGESTLSSARSRSFSPVITLLS